MTFLELCKRFHLESGVGGESRGELPASVAGQTDQLLKIVTWIKQAWLEIQHARNDWLFMQDKGSLVISAGTSEYSLVVPSSTQSITSITRSGAVATATKTNHGYVIGQSIVVAGASQTEYNGTKTITSITSNTFTYVVSTSAVTPATGTITAATIAISAEKIIPYTAIANSKYILVSAGDVGLTDQQPCYYFEQDEFDGYFNRLSYSGNTGKPQRYTVLPNGYICVDPVPDKSYLASFRFNKTPAVLSLNSDVPAFPEKFHMLIVYQALTYYAGTAENTQLIQYAPRMRQAMFSDLVREQTPRILDVCR